MAGATASIALDRGEAAILDEARRARLEGADFVVLSMHWGKNYDAAPDELQTSVGPRMLASPDIDLILGHHAHIVQPVTQIGGEFLVYGLGNFLSNQSAESCDECPVGARSARDRGRASVAPGILNCGRAAAAPLRSGSAHSQGPRRSNVHNRTAGASGRSETMVDSCRVEA